MWLSENTLKKLIKGTFLATLLLAAQEGGRPFHEAAWILIGATLTTVVDAYATHLSHRSYGDFRAYAQSVGGPRGRLAAHLRHLPHGVVPGVGGDFPLAPRPLESRR